MTNSPVKLSGKDTALVQSAGPLAFMRQHAAKSVEASRESAQVYASAGYTGKRDGMDRRKWQCDNFTCNKDTYLSLIHI